jgi:hypothetical protein
MKTKSIVTPPQAGAGTLPKLYARRILWLLLCVWFVPLAAVIGFVFADEDPLRRLLQSWPALPPEGGPTK